MPQNLLKNSGFEADWGEKKSHRCLVFPTGKEPYEADVGNIFTPPEWLTWFRHVPDKWDQPEVRDAWATHDPRRVHSGQKGMLLFTFYRKHDAGFLQQVQVTPGARLRLAAWAHAWSNWHGGPHPDDPRWSDGPGYNAGFLLEGQAPDDNWRNFAFYVGIDPTGGTNPFADTVVWGQGAHIYNQYAQPPAVEATAQADRVTVFLRSKTLWPFKHNDAYWDDAELVAVGEEEPEPPPPPQQPAWNYPIVARGSKLGVHSLRPSTVGAWSTQLLSNGTYFPVVKAVNDMDWLMAIKQTSPKTVTVARITSQWEACNEINHGGDLDKLANRLMKLILDKLGANPALRAAVDYWEVCNEPVPVGIEGAVHLCDVMKKCMDRAEAEGLKLAIFSLAAGTPEWDQMVAMTETGVFGRARLGGHILALHEGVFADDAIDKWWGELIPGSVHVEGAGALCFRYRYFYHLLQQRGEVVPLVVSEIVFGGGYQGKQTPAQQVERARWYDDRMRQDYWVLGFCPFTVGPIGQWNSQNYEYAYPAFLDYMVSIKDAGNAVPPLSPEPPPPPEPPPAPCRGAPRVQYERTYVLMPPGAGAEWAKAVVTATWDTRQYTIGGSADDAGIGDLDVRRVIAVNPGQWPGDLRAFFEAYYPGVVYVPVEAATPAGLAQALKQL